MWVILLDRSGSMGEPFSATDAAKGPGRKRQTLASTKWQAAKEAVISEVGSLQPAERVLLFTFNSNAVLAFDGTASQLNKLQLELEGIAPENGTDLAVALRTVNEHLRALGAQHMAVEVISDGLSDLIAAREAAEQLARIVALIEVILIDPTDEGMAVANAVAQRGKVISVSSDRELATEVTEASQRQTAEQERVSQALAKAAEERQVTVSRVPQDERLSLTVGYPGSPAIGIWHSLVTYLHVPGSKKEVQKRLATRSREAGQRLTESSSHIIAMRGTWFTLIPHIDGVQFNPPQQEVAWLEDLQEVVFRFQVGAEFEGKSLVGRLEVLANGLDVAVVPLALRVGAVSWADGNDPWETSSGSLFEEVFASYSRNDLKIVDACAKIYKALGIQLFVDRHDLLGGQEWHPALLQKIENSDAFQLFWSNSSRTSHYVEEEWQHAMSMRSQKGHRFLRPLYWTEPKPDAPAELNQLNFSFFDLSAFENFRPADEGKRTSPEDGAEQRVNKKERDTKDESTSELLAQRASDVQACVIPLLAGESRQSLALVRNDVNRAVVFLEDLTGLRYYPVPTLMVDEFTVRKAREARNMTDEVPAQPHNADAANELEMWTDVLQALLLQFHVREVPPLASNLRANKIVDGYEGLEEPVIQHSVIPAPALEGLRQLAEWGISGWIWNYQHFPWEEDKHSDQPRDDSSHSLSEYVISALDSVLATLQKTQLREKEYTLPFSRPTSSDPTEFDDRVAWEAVSKVLGTLGLYGTRKRATFIPPVEANDSWGYEVTASTSTLITALQHIRDSFSEQLSAFDGVDYSASDRPNASGLFCIGLAVTAAKIVDSLRWDLPEKNNIWGRWSDTWVIETIYPSWRRVRDWMAAVEPVRPVPMGPAWSGSQALPGMMADYNFSEFLRAYFSVMEIIYREGLATSPHFPWTQQYGIPESAWTAIQERDSDLNIALIKSESWGQAIGGEFTYYVELFHRAGERLLAALPAITPRNKKWGGVKKQAKEVVESSLFGAFVPAGAANVDSQLLTWATQNGVMQQAVLPETPRVLYCTRPLSQMADSSEVAMVRRALQQCVTLHEHFHAILETGISPDGQAADGPRDAAAWSKATPLNESLAAWMEWHFVRQHGTLLSMSVNVEELKKAMWAYICCGNYPAWPYRGAERIEAIYTQQGISAVRTLIQRLRENPASAQNEFNKIAA